MLMVTPSLPGSSPENTMQKEVTSLNHNENATMERTELTEEDVRTPYLLIGLSAGMADLCQQNRRIRRKTDKVILSILIWVYFLQESIENC